MSRSIEVIVADLKTAMAESKVAGIKKWDSAFSDNGLAKSINKKAYDMVPFSELAKSDQSKARRSYPASTTGGKYDFAYEHFFYPVKRDGSITSGNRHLAIPIKKINDEKYMSRLGYEIRKDWKTASSKVADDRGKVYSTMTGVGRAKYVVNFHDGVKTHGDGSPFSDIATFSNKKVFNDFVRSLKKEGYKEGKTASSSKVAIDPNMVLRELKTIKVTRAEGHRVEGPPTLEGRNYRSVKDLEKAFAALPESTYVDKCGILITLKDGSEISQMTYFHGPKEPALSNQINYYIKTRVSVSD